MIARKHFVRKDEIVNLECVLLDIADDKYID